MKGALAFSAALFLAVPVYAEPVQLKFGYPGPLTAWPYTKGFGPWAQEVERDAPGLVEIKVYPGGAIATFRNAYDRTINGVADMTFGTFGDTPGQACAAIDRHSGAALSLRMGKAADEINVEGKAKFIAMGGHVVAALDPAETARWKQALAPITEEWIKTVPDGTAVLAAFRAELVNARRAQ
jgi:TRAP-type C4-dicarboxylate transport system substrate-binding protein